MKNHANPEQIVDLCMRHGLDVAYVSQRFRFKHCPTCGSDKWKLWLYDKTCAGSCFRCHTAYNLFSLFKAHDLPVTEVAKTVGVTIKSDAELEEVFDLKEETEEKTEKKATELPLALAKNRYFRIDEWPRHPAAKYAVSRGVHPDLYDRILIDVELNAVCFLVFENEKAVGYQLRYVRPVREKTYTAKDFLIGEHLLEYRRDDGELFVCEGPFNAATAYSWGHTGLCTFGSRITATQIDKLCAIATNRNKPLCCAFDMDDSGWHAFLQVKDVATARGIDVRKVEPEIGNDLNDSMKEGKGYKFVDCFASSLLQYLPDLC